MSEQIIPGRGGKRPQLDIGIERLHADGENPRLPEEAQNKSEPELLNVLYRDFYLDELAESMAQNGYFDEEPLVAIPIELPAEFATPDTDDPAYLAFLKTTTTQFTVVEGNRRLATAKILLDSSLRQSLRIKHWPELNEQVTDDLASLPVIVYPKRSDVIPYLGVRHIIGIQKWDAYAKARYVAKLVEGGRSIRQVEDLIGDKQSSVTKNYLSYKLLSQAKDEFDIDTKPAKSNFSLLILAIGQGSIKRFIGLPAKLSTANLDAPVPEDKLPNLQMLITWVYGAKDVKPVIDESRDITNYLTHVVTSSEAVTYLNRTKDLIGAYDRTDGEEKMLLKYISAANIKIETALGVAHRHKTFEVRTEAERCWENASQLLKRVTESHDSTA